jgi:hypothetical protein
MWIIQHYIPYNRYLPTTELVLRWLTPLSTIFHNMHTTRFWNNLIYMYSNRLLDYLAVQSFNFWKFMMQVIPEKNMLCTNLDIYVLINMCIVLKEWVSDCLILRYIVVRTNYFLMRWWYMFPIRPIRWVWFYIATSFLQSTNRHVFSLRYFILTMFIYRKLLVFLSVLILPLY